MQWLAEVCVRRPIFASVLMLVLVVVGAAGYAQLGLDRLPNADVPIVVVTTLLPGAAPEEMEADVSDRIEGAVNTISGIDELRSVSSEGASQVIISFTLETDVDTAAQEVRDKVSTILPDLPSGIDQPVISKVDVNAAPVLLVALRGGADIRALTELADKRVRRQIESIAGVGHVSLIGGRKRQVNVWLDPVALRASGLTATDVERAIAAQNLSSPGGTIERGPNALSVRVLGRVTSVEAIGRIVVRESGGAPLRVENVARVEDGEEPLRSWAQLDDQRTVVLSIRKQSGKNTVAVVDSVKARLAAIKASLPAGLTLEIVRDNSEVVRTGVHAVTEHLIVGAILAALVVLLFLGSARSTLIAALAIPISIIGTFAVMWAQGFTLNLLTLLALALAVGIVIDDAIVVLENIVRHIEEKGSSPRVAAVAATKEIGLAVLATTLSLLAVFVPVAFMGGLVGRFLKSFGLTMAFAIAVSMIVSFSLTPALAARWLVPRHGRHRAPSRLERLVDIFYRPMERGYMRLLRWSMRHRWVVVVACVLSLVSAPPLAASLPSGFMPPDDNGQYEVNLRAPSGTTISETRLIAERVATDLRTLPGHEHTLLTVGGDERQTSNLAKISVFLTDPKSREEGQLELMDLARKQVLAKLPPSLRVTAGEIADVSTGDSTQTIQYALTGPDLAQLNTIATRITDELRKVHGAVDVDNTVIAGKPELRISIDRERAADLGVRVADVAMTLRLLLAGGKASSYAEKGETYDVVVRGTARFRNDPEALGFVTVASSKHGTVPLGAVISSSASSTAAEINRRSRQRQVTIVANSAPGVGDGSVDRALHEIADRVGLPVGYTLEPSGFSKETSRTANAFLFAFGLSFVFMYLVLAAQFESWLHPVTILLSLPLTLPFALASLHVFGQTLNLFTALGLLVLFGVVKKNAILQIDHTNALRREGCPRDEAILRANKDRLRPILMTTIAFVAGMIPLLLSKGIGAGQSQSTAGIVLGGQTLSLLLTLLAVPVIYSLFDDAAAWTARRFGRTGVPVELGADGRQRPHTTAEGRA